MRRREVVLTLLLLSVRSSCSGDPARDTPAVYVDTGDPGVFARTEDSTRDRWVRFHVRLGSHGFAENRIGIFDQDDIREAVDDGSKTPSPGDGAPGVDGP